MWFYFALLTTIFSALIVVINKYLLKDTNPLLLFWEMILIATPIIFFLVLREGFSSINMYFVIGVLGSNIGYTISRIWSYRAIKIENLSDIYPIYTFGSIFTLLIAFLPPLSEKPNSISTIGVIIVIVGSYLLNVEKAKEGVFKPFTLLLKNKAPFLMIMAMLVGSVTPVFDKFAINNSFPKSATFTLLIENLLMIVFLFPFVYFQNRNFHKQIRLNLKLLIPLGVLNAAATFFGMNAIGQGNVGIVNGIFRMQLLLVLLFSFIFFKDKPRREIILGTIIMLAGVILIKLGS